MSTKTFKRGTYAIAAAVAAMGLAGSARAGNLYWDINGTNPGATDTTSATGTWDLAATTWNTDATGVATPGIWSTTETAVFAAGSNATGDSAITVTGTIAAAGVTVEEGTFSFGSSGIVSTGTGPIVVNAGATLSYNTNARFSTTVGSTVTLNGGTLTCTNPGNAGTFFDQDSEIVMGTGGGTLSYTTANVLNIVQTGTKITGSGSLTKAGAGVLAIASTAGNNTYSGGTIVNDGELRIRTVPNTLPITTALTVNSPGVFNLNGVSQQVSSLTGSGNVGTGTGTLTISGTASTTFDGALKNIANAGAGAVTTGNGKLTKSGTGVITFNGLNDINGNVTLTDGGIIVGATGSLCGDICDVNVNGGTLTLNNATETIENLSGTGGAIVLGTGHTLTSIPTATADTTTASTISGAGAFALNKAGAKLTLTGNNTYAGGTTITAGTIKAGSATALGAGPASVASGASLVVTTVDTAADLTKRVSLASLNNAGLVDVDKGGVKINAGVVESNLRAQIISGRNGGAWTGTTGITSSTAATSGGTRHVGYVMNSPTNATVAYSASGDTDLNHTVNTDDILNILSAGKLDQNLDANWQEGDFNYDNRANTDDILQILSEGVLDAGPYTRDGGGSTTNLVGPFPANAKVIYDPSNGNVKVNPNGVNVSGFNLQDSLADATNVFAGPENPAFPTGALSTTNTDVKVAWATISAPVTTTVDLGNIALPGLNAATLLAQLSDVASPLGANDTYYTIQGIAGRLSFDLVVVPEPGTLGLAAIAGFGLLARRKLR